MITTDKIILIIAIVLIIMLFVVLSSRTRIIKLYKKYLGVSNSTGITGHQLAYYAVDRLNLPNLSIRVMEGELIDAYIPKYKTLLLSEDVSNFSSIASLAIVAHELGHAVQDRQNNPLFGLVTILKRITRFTNKFIMPLLVFGTFMAVGAYFRLFEANIGEIANNMMVASGVLFIIHAVVKFATIPLEYDASKKGLMFLKDNNYLNKSELRQAKKLLKVAAQTYISSLFDGILIFSHKLSHLIYKR